MTQTTATMLTTHAFPGERPEASDEVLGVIVGSAFSLASFSDWSPEAIEIDTRWGPWTIYRLGNIARPCYLSFRHGIPHRLLPNQIPYRAQMRALSIAGCRSVLSTSSVGVLDDSVPLNTPLIVSDILTLDNRLPDGSACTMFDSPSSAHAHLVLNEGLVSPALVVELERILRNQGIENVRHVVFGYVGGPRTKTGAENRMWKNLGAQVNSMTLAPEIILANELNMSAAGLVAGHKPSRQDARRPQSKGEVTDSLEDSRKAMSDAIRAFIKHGKSAPFGNQLYRF